MQRIVLYVLAGVFVFGVLPRKAAAVVAFKREFQKLYITDETDEEFANLVKSNKTGCLVCHQGKNRKHHNPYGEHLEKLLDKKKDIKDKEKIIAALKKVEAMHSDPNDDKSPTYGELIAANKFPGGTLEELEKEPEGEDGENEAH